MQGVRLRGKSYEARLRIPDELRTTFGKNDFRKGLGTREYLKACQLAAPILRGWKEQIDAHREGMIARQADVPARQDSQTFSVDPSTAERAIARWQRAAIQNSYLDHFNRLTPDQLGDEASARSELRYRLDQREPWKAIADFDARMIAALDSEGLEIPVDHPALARVRPWFAAAWRETERFDAMFERDDFSEWMEGGANSNAERTTSSLALSSIAATSQPPAILTMAELLDRYCAIEKPKDEGDIRYHFGRLIEATGNVTISAITPSQLQDFRGNVACFPRTRKPEIVNLPFSKVISDHGVEPFDPFEDYDAESPDAYPPLSPTTVWKWCLSVKTVFQFAVDADLLHQNPAAKLPKKPSDDERGKVRAFEPAEIKALFSTPLFRGCDKVRDKDGALYGYRKNPGSLLVKDAHYWLPLFALWQGCRLEEIGFASVDEIKEVEGVACLDLRERHLNRIKNRQSRRLLPIHPRLMALGFLDYVAEQRQAGQTYVFPELPHDLGKGRYPKRSTRQFSKWWGHWMHANGFPQRDINFHSFRHTFKTACVDLPEVLHDFLTGHKYARGSTAESVGRRYVHIDVHKSFETISKVDYPDFPIPAGGMPW